MYYKESIIQRKSTRTFLNTEINLEKQKEIKNLLENITIGPFGNIVKFYLLKKQ